MRKKPPADGAQRRAELESRREKRALANGVHIESLPGRNEDERMRVLTRMLRTWQSIGFDPVNLRDLRTLSVISSYSPTHLQRTYKRVFGQSPYRHALRERMELARDLLCETGLYVGDVAGYAGYHDRAAFARAFRRYFGTTPTAMRASARAKAGV